jgi:hypothetical protein
MPAPAARRTTRIAREIRAMRRSIAMLDRAVRRLGPILRTVAHTNGSPSTGKPRRRLTLSRDQRAALKLQGRYMGFIRQLTPKGKAEVRRIREKKGVEAAIRRAQSLARS